MGPFLKKTKILRNLKIAIQHLKWAQRTLLRLSKIKKIKSNKKIFQTQLLQKETSQSKTENQN